jgi:hypothetical protein
MEEFQPFLGKPTSRVHEAPENHMAVAAWFVTVAIRNFSARRRETLSSLRKALMKELLTPLPLGSRLDAFLYSILDLTGVQHRPNEAPMEAQLS